MTGLDDLCLELALFTFGSGTAGPQPNGVGMRRKVDEGTVEIEEERVPVSIKGRRLARLHLAEIGGLRPEVRSRPSGQFP